MKRLPAEWEQQSFIQFTFPHQQSDWAYKIDEVTKCFVELITRASLFEDVLVICDNTERVRSFFQSSDHIYFLQIQSNDVWARDYGGITIIEDNNPIVYDFVFNGWGQKYDAQHDNQITRQIFNNKVFKNCYLQSVEMVLEGGSIDCDGQGTLLTTSRCLHYSGRNPGFSKTQIENNLKQYFGASRVLWIDHGYLAGDDTDAHIDTLARFFNETTIAYVGCSNSNDEHFDELQIMKAQLLQFTDPNENPYTLIDLPLPDPCFDSYGNRLPASYANFTIINDAVLVPTYGVQQDKEAINIFKICFPKREIIDINCRILIEQGGSLHCITMQYPKPVELNKELIL